MAVPFSVCIAFYFALYAPFWVLSKQKKLVTAGVDVVKYIIALVVEDFLDSQCKF